MLKKIVEKLLYEDFPICREILEYSIFQLEQPNDTSDALIFKINLVKLNVLNVLSIVICKNIFINIYTSTKSYLHLY